MKKFIPILCILLSINVCFAGKYTSTIEKIENSVFGFTYSGDDESRISRLEKTIYGETKSGTQDSRISALKKDMSADSIGQEITPKEDTFADDEIYTPDNRMAGQNTIPPAGANVDYPSVNELEAEIFKTEHKHLDLTTRLSNLEKKVLGKTYENDPFSSRVERLQAKVKPKSFMQNSLAQTNNEYYDGDIMPLDKDYYLDEYRAPDFDYESYNAQHRPPAKINIASVEKSLYKKSYNNEDLDTRLTRLESTMFGTTFKEDSQQERLNRISGAYKATKSVNKYDSNKFTQNMATAMQIGTIILMILACVL